MPKEVTQMLEQNKNDTRHIIAQEGWVIGKNFVVTHPLGAPVKGPRPAPPAPSDPIAAAKAALTLAKLTRELEQLSQTSK
jgi:hypothetical protein